MRSRTRFVTVRFGNVLDMGEPVRIADLEEGGMRPGEKLFEELSVDAEAAVRGGLRELVPEYRPDQGE